MTTMLRQMTKAVGQSVRVAGQRNMSQVSGAVIGVDLGTTNSCVAVLDG